MGMFVPFGEWLPDLPVFENPGATIAKNVIPDTRSYRSFPTQVAYSNALGSRCQGAIIARDNTGSYFNYAGDTSALYVLNVNSFSSVTKLATTYATDSNDAWEFAQFGQRLIAVNGFADSAQAITVGAANFADLGGGSPKAKHVAVVRDFVVMGNISATATSPQMVRWCAINNVNSWTPDAATMADFQDLPGDGGHITKVVGGEYGTIFQQRAIFRMTFVGSPLVFQFDKVLHNNIGAIAPNSVVSYRNTSFFLAEDGFYMFDGSNVMPIGQNKIDRTFYDDFDAAYYHRVWGAVDPVHKVVAWAYPGSGNTGGNPNRVLLYNWSNKRWSRIEDLNIELLFRYASSSITLDTLDTLHSNIDAMVISLDDNSWVGGVLQLSCFDSAHRLATFNGSAMPATIETNEMQFNRQPDGLAYVTQLRPVLEGISASVTLAVAARDVLTQSASYGSAMSPNSTGYAEVRSTGRFHRIQLNTSNNFDHLQGVDVTLDADGVR